MVCVYCCESYEDSEQYRRHMDAEHQVFRTRNAFHHLNEGFVKVDCTDLLCRICEIKFEDLKSAAKHLVIDHKKDIKLDHEIGLQPFVMPNNKFMCALCDYKAISIRRLSFHTQIHFLKYTCELCGKSYSTLTSLHSHTRYSHTEGAYVCRKCRKTFNRIEDRRTHFMESQNCWPYLCHLCGERFMTWKMKQIHMTDVHSVQKRKIRCKECDEMFDERRKYSLHFKVTHTDDNFVCSCCGMKFPRRRALEEHKVIHTKEKLFPCTVCPKSFGRRKNLTQHMWIHNEYKRFKCSVCNKLFNQRVSWRTHMSSHHPEVEVDFNEGKKFSYRDNDAMTYTRANAHLIIENATAYPFRLPEGTTVCVFCCDPFEDPVLFREHMETEHENFKSSVAFAHLHEGYLKVDVTDLRCRLCECRIANLKAVATHLHDEHKVGIHLNADLGLQPFLLEKDKWVCVICNERFNNMRSLSRHTSRHFTRYTCGTCGKSYPTSSAIRVHETTHLETKKICRRCRQPFSSKEQLRIHLEQSQTCGTHVCNICGARFATWIQKQKHKTESHAVPKRTYTCPECKQTFTNPDSCRTHFKTVHTNDCLECTCCGRKFVSEYKLKRHMVSHTGQREFQCSVCSKAFPRKSTLDQHMWIHRAVKKWVCLTCDKQFNQKVSWKTHMKSHHSEQCDL